VWQTIKRLLNALAEKAEIESAIYIMQINEATEKPPSEEPPDDYNGQYL